MVLPRLLRQFCLTTSLKGVPRIIRSKSPFLQGLWLISVITFLGVSFFGAYSLISEFLKYPKVTIITESSINLWDIKMPNVMVCNINPISSNYSQVDGVPSMEEYGQLVVNLTTCKHCSSDEEEKLEALREELLTTQGYYQYIGKGPASKIGHQYKDFVVKCHVLSLEGPALRRRPCTPFMTISQLVTPEYFNCYIFRFTHNQPGVSVYGLSLILYLDNFVEFETPYFNTLTDSGQATGIKVLVYEANSLPMFMSEAMDIPPGMYSTISLKGERRDRMTEPWGKCISKNRMKEKFLGFPIEYTAEGCFVLCTEENITGTCNCKDEWFSGYLDDVYHEKYQNVPYCMEVDEGLEHLQKSMECIRNARMVAFNECLQQCSLPCHDTIYHKYISQSKWPAQNTHKAFYDNIIKNKPYSIHFPTPHNGHIDKETSSATCSCPNSNLSQTIFDNFIKMNVLFGDYRYIHLKDIAKITWSQLISQLGGTLNLWSGITVILVVEFLDLLYQFIMSLGQERSVQEDDETKRTHSISTIQGDMRNAQGTHRL